MASIFSAAKQMINKISDEVNKDKWDKSCINQALFTDPEPGKLVPPSRHDSRPVPPEKTVNVQPAVVPPQAEANVNAQPVTGMATAVNTAAPLVATAPQIEYSTEKPQVKQSATAAEPEKKEPVKFINSRFNRSINYVTSKVVKPAAGGVRSISDLPVVDPAQSISSISGMTLGAGGEPVPEESVPAAAPVQEPVQPVQKAEQPATDKPAQSQPSPAVAAAMRAAAELAAAQAAQNAPAAAAMQQPAAQQPMAQPVMAQPVAQQPMAQPVMAQPVAQQPMAQPVMAQPVAQQPVAQPVMAQPAAQQPMVQPVMAQPAVEYQPAPVMEAPVAVEEPQSTAAVEEEPEKCYYVLITHTKTQPAEGKCVLMRNCDYQYAWTDSMDESEKPSYDTCPVCGKPIEYIETEMD